MRPCELNENVCADNSGCYHISHLCDGECDCTDCSDENPLVCTFPTTVAETTTTTVSPTTTLTPIVDTTCLHRIESSITAGEVYHFPNGAFLISFSLCLLIYGKTCSQLIFVALSTQSFRQYVLPLFEHSAIVDESKSSL